MESDNDEDEEEDDVSDDEEEEGEEEEEEEDDTNEAKEAEVKHVFLGLSSVSIIGLMPLSRHPFGLPHYAQNSHFPYPELNPVPKLKP